ncbi:MULTISPECIES: protein-glutamate O-methyltransferase CheR [unclassified Salinivibrio]|uniref:CheR family methyltransferase n=1 Tax=unclassified Salinivibrio TaxID=2636825 RepID=UPI00128C8534|nr:MULTISPECIES: protein-glutamate O-methyltransferase CheR [unclassified Salinivibrio]MPS32298.1 protein-glutamate O-methyltransferase CheR [Salinivibrio sp. VYel7]MPX93691.1 protein-glutamate O-methyltransferase CheR [Salinivibrio sp. VYel9]MPX96522.1 protein-glutamate O-methyltransferase CheR [Salinivibrio sp. VYel6]MPX99826.1 protein-glutamate O-methyltransferase CheR [Salinivibrio sp. VYel4]MPY02960.1 protein-glutamate O-methyltransferase CheR [Salinivibrio sp. VYel5]
MSAPVNASSAGAYDFSQRHFHYVQTFMQSETGIFLADKKKSMVYGRLARCLRRTGMATFDDYFALVEQSKDERVAFINALTTNKTQFFRERHHFEFLAYQLIPQWQAAKQKRIRIWSAGCSTGEEPYTIASVLAGHGMLEGQLDVQILATDLDTQVLNTASNGTYSLEVAHTIPKAYLQNGFLKGKGIKQDLFKAKRQLRDVISFKQLNLKGEWPHKHAMDAIFCRNVMIYFERDTQQRLIERFWQQLVPGGVLFIGHSEGIGKMAERFDNLGHTMYRKRE